MSGLTKQQRRTRLTERIAFWTFAKAQKTLNLRRDPRITCLLEISSDLRLHKLCARICPSQF